MFGTFSPRLMSLPLLVFSYSWPLSCLPSLFDEEYLTVILLETDADDQGGNGYINGEYLFVLFYNRFLSW